MFNSSILASALSFSANKTSLRLSVVVIIWSKATFIFEASSLDVNNSLLTVLAISVVLVNYSFNKDAFP